MAKTDKPFRPPISKGKIRQRLGKAADTQCLVGLRRWIPDADYLEGFVVGQSPAWTLLARLSDRIELDGWIAVRTEDIQSVTLIPVEDCFEIKALRARSQWPPTGPASVRMSSAQELVETISRVTPMASIFREYHRPDVCWIGAVRKINAETVSLLEVNVAGGWARKPRHFDLDDITRLDFGGGYEEALLMVAGAPPSSRSASPAEKVMSGTGGARKTK